MELTDDNRTDMLTQLKMRYGYDFINYAHASMDRRIARFADINKITTVFELKHRLLNSKGFFADFVSEITVNVTEMFRDPESFLGIQKSVFPYLATYPLIKIWHAGCATGEEVYSNAILLKEHALLGKSRIYATDLSQPAIAAALRGSYPAALMKDYEKSYLASGGMQTLKGYFTLSNDRITIDPVLRKNIVFTMHNLVTDGSFNEFNLIVCKNVLIYFNRGLQNKVYELFYDSLAPLGYLVLGPRESLSGSPVKSKFETVDRKAKIYRKIN